MIDAVHVGDLHLGSDCCDISALEDFLVWLPPTRRLILGGDVLQGTEHRLTGRHWSFLSRLRVLSHRTELVWVWGNHDHDAEAVAHLVGAEWCREYTYESGSRRLLVVHGDQFDPFVTKWPRLTRAVDVAHGVLSGHWPWAAYKLARLEAWARKCVHVKAGALAHAKKSGCDGVVFAHTHRVDMGDDYVNPGCWTKGEGHAAVVEAGKWHMREFS